MTEPYKIIEVKESVFADNDREAARLRTQLKQDRTFLLNLMSSPGSGKTTTLLRTLEALKDELRIGVMEADIDSDVDAKTIADAGVKSIQLHTGGMCHLDAEMSRQGLRAVGAAQLDAVILENVPTGSAISMGSRVTVREVGEEDEETYEIVGSQEANPILGRISDESPLGRSLMGKKKGDRIEFEAPGGVIYYEILNCEN